MGLVEVLQEEEAERWEEEQEGTGGEEEEEEAAEEEEEEELVVVVETGKVQWRNRLGWEWMLCMLDHDLDHDKCVRVCVLSTHTYIHV
jgi:hypothetical protein